MAVKGIEKIVEDFDSTSSLTPEQQLQAYTVDILAQNSEGTKVGTRTGTSKVRADGSKTRMIIHHSDDWEKHTIKLALYGNGSAYQTETSMDKAEWARYIHSALYRREVKDKLEEIDKLDSTGDVLEDIQPFEKAVETLTALLAPMQRLTLGSKSVDVSIRQNVFKSVYEDCLADIDAAYELLATKFDYFNEALGEGQSLSVGSRVLKYAKAYSIAERRCKELK